MFKNACPPHAGAAKRLSCAVGPLLVVALTAAACGSASDDASPALAEADTTTTAASLADPEPESTLEEENDEANGEEAAPEHAGTDDDGVHLDEAGEPPEDHNHAEEETDSGEPLNGLITEATDGTPEIGAVVEPGSPVPAGAYALSILGEDWRLGIDHEIMLDGSDQVVFGFTTQTLRDTPHFLGFLATVGIVPPSQVGIHQEHDPIVPDVTVAIPEDLDTWLGAVPQVQVVDRGTSIVGGAPATWYRLTVDPAAGQTFHCHFGDNCAGFVVHPRFGVTVLAPEIDVTVWQLDALPGVMPWVQVEDPANVESAQQVMADLLAGLVSV